MSITNPVYFTFLLFGFVFNASAVSSDVKYRQSISEIGQQIKRVSKNLNKSKSKLKSERQNLFEIEKTLVKMSSNVDSISRAIDKKGKESKVLNEELAKTQFEQSENREALKGLLIARYKHGSDNHLKLLLNQENPYAVGRINNYHEYFSSALKEKLDKLKIQISIVADLKVEKDKALKELKRQQKELSAKKTKLAETKKHRAKSIAKLNRNIDESGKKLDRLKQDKDRLNTLLTQIAQQAKKLKRIEEQRRKEKAALEVKENKKSRTQRQPVLGGFKKQKGRLNFPVKGVKKRGFGARLAESGMRSDGVYFSTEKSVDVKSIFRGRVLFSDFLKGYGLLLIIDHGEDHISLYGHNELLYKKVGDSVDTNEVVAKTGVTGGLKSPGLYFEIRKNTTPVNPANWCQ